MADKFYDGMPDVNAKLNAMDRAFAAGPYDALPKTGGTLTGPVTSTSSIRAVKIDAVRTTSALNTVDNAGRWYKVAKIIVGYESHSFQASIRVMGTASYGAIGTSTAVETVIMLRVDNDSIPRGHFYSLGGLPENTVSAVRVALDGTVYIRANQYFMLQPFIDSMIALPQGIEQADPPVDATELSPIFGLKLGAANTLLVKSDQIELGAQLISQAISPHTDNGYDIGTAGRSFRTIYARTGAINTSDARLKTDYRMLTPSEVAAARDIARAIGVYRWRDAIEQKGDEAREHIGPTVQRAIEIMQAHGLDPFNYGFICHDAWERQVVEHPALAAQAAIPGGFPAVEARAAYTEVVREAGDRYAFRYDELAMFIAAGQEARLAALEAA